MSIQAIIERRGRPLDCEGHCSEKIKGTDLLVVCITGQGHAQMITYYCETCARRLGLWKPDGKEHHEWSKNRKG